MSWGTHHPHHRQHPTGAWALWARTSHPVCSPGCWQAVMSALTELPKQGLKHFPAACHAMAVNFGLSNVCLVPILYAGRGFLKALPRAGSPRQPHCKNTIAWPIVVHHEEIKGAGGEREEGYRSLCPPVNPSNSCCGSQSTFIKWSVMWCLSHLCSPRELLSRDLHLLRHISAAWRATCCDKRLTQWQAQSSPELLLSITLKCKALLTALLISPLFKKVIKPGWCSDIRVMDMITICHY